MPERGVRLVLGLGTAQTLGWASSYYLPALLAAPMAAELGIATPMVFAAFTLALLVSAAIGPRAGRLIDRHGGRPVLMASSRLFTAALLAMALAGGPVSLFAAWALMGLAMGSGLYEAAFAALVRLRGQEARRAITGITLVAGFASTVGWPLTAWMEAQFGWRGACAGWAGLHLLLGLPLYAALPAAPARPEPAADAPPALAAATAAPSRLQFALLAFVFAATWFISTALATHWPALLQASGLSLAGAVALGALIGPAQVAGRLLEFGWLSRLHPLLTARLAAIAHPLGALGLLLLGPLAAPAFALLHGAGNGILTIAKGNLPLVLFGAAGYGERQGWLMLPARVAQAGAPLLFGLAIERWGAGALWLSTGIGGLALLALLAIHPRGSPQAIDGEA